MRVRVYCEIPLDVDADYTPERPAPMVHCHDDPGFSDSGDSEECEITAAHIVTHKDGREILVPLPGEIKDMVYDLIAEDVIDECRQAVKSECTREEYDEDHRDDMRTGNISYVRGER